MTLSLFGDTGGAVLSSCNRYRYKLTRQLVDPLERSRRCGRLIGAGPEQVVASHGIRFNVVGPDIKDGYCRRDKNHKGDCRTFPSDDTVCVFAMLNPSTADAERDDPTIRRCKVYARDWGYTELIVVNLYAYRATMPRDLMDARQRGVDPVGEDNDHYIIQAVQQANQHYLEHRGPMVVCAWGSSNTHEPHRATAVRKLIGSAAHVLRLNITDHTPAHPLRLPADLEPTPWPL